MLHLCFCQFVVTIQCNGANVIPRYVSRVPRNGTWKIWSIFEQMEEKIHPLRDFRFIFPAVSRSHATLVLIRHRVVAGSTFGGSISNGTTTVTVMTATTGCRTYRNATIPFGFRNFRCWCGSAPAHISAYSNANYRNNLKSQVEKATKKLFFSPTELSWAERRDASVACGTKNRETEDVNMVVNIELRHELKLRERKNRIPTLHSDQRSLLHSSSSLSLPHLPRKLSHLTT